MIVEAQVTKDFKHAFDNLHLQKQRIVEEKIDLLANNPRHPSLQTQKLYRPPNVWECKIDTGMRLLYQIKKGILYLWDLGGHAVVDKAHLRGFSSSHFIPWNLTAQTTAGISIEPTRSRLANYVPTELSFDTSDVPVNGTLNYFAYFPTAHLRILGVPEELVQAVKDAPLFEDILALPGLSEAVRLSFMDLSTSPKLEAVLLDSSRLLYRTTLDRLAGYFEGKIKKLMLNLLPELQQYVEMKEAPLFLLKGVAGSGKTTIGIYRAIHLASQDRRVLMLAFNNALSSVTRSLIEELIGPLPENLEVRTLHSLMTRILRNREISLNIPEDEKAHRQITHKCLQEALYQVQMGRMGSRASVLKRDESFFQEEIERVIKGFGLENLEEYKEVRRYGRKTALHSLQREAVWAVYEVYQQRLDQAKVHDWSDVALLAWQSLRKQPLEEAYDDVIVDEAQDLTPVDYRVFQLLAASPTDSAPQLSSILILGDAAQTLYSRGFSWEQAGIQARGRTVILRKNHRNTRQIGEAAAHLLKQNVLMNAANEYIDPEWIERQGKPPKLLHATYSPNVTTGWLNQIALVRDCILDLVSRQVFRLSDFAVLCPNNEFCRRCQQELTQGGLRAVLRNDRNFHILEEQIKVLTIHSAKGLEFPAVFLLGLTEDDLPPTYRLHSLEEEEKQLEIEKQRILCYVGMTRAAEELYLVTVEGRESRFVRELEGKIVLN
jgi:superfamily I DNA/RNA helicase/mRNA-degrading endonuclease YafQ of YafQ-DinJ toxin-antitoxin module